MLLWCHQGREEMMSGYTSGWWIYLYITLFPVKEISNPSPTTTTCWGRKDLLHWTYRINTYGANFNPIMFCHQICNLLSEVFSLHLENKTRWLKNWPTSFIHALTSCSLIAKWAVLATCLYFHACTPPQAACPSLLPLLWCVFHVNTLQCLRYIVRLPAIHSPTEPI